MIRQTTMTQLHSEVAFDVEAETAGQAGPVLFVDPYEFLETLYEGKEAKYRAQRSSRWYEFVAPVQGELG